MKNSRIIDYLYVMIVLESLWSIALLVENIANTFEELTIFRVGSERFHVAILCLAEIAFFLVYLTHFNQYLGITRLHVL